MDILHKNIVAYGVTTGFGALSKVTIKSDEASLLSRNIVVSHACCVGSPMPSEYVKAGILIRINTLAKACSGVSLTDALLGLLNHNIIPIVPQFGSLACSGDLAPLAHVALVISESVDEKDTADNDVIYNCKRMSGKEAMTLAGVKRTLLGPKDGLAITNGSTFTAGMA